MNEEKVKTIAERFGFKDKDLTTPEHDKILLWLLNDKNLIKVLEELGVIKRIENYKILGPFCQAYKCDWSWDSMSCSGVCAWDKEERRKRKEKMRQTFSEINSFIKEIHFKYPDLIKLEKKVEAPIITSEKYTIGFIDLLIHIDTEFQINNSFAVEFYEKTGKILYIEIKPKINSIGELIRQINFYRSYLPQDSLFAVVTRTAGLKPILNDQNILVYEVKHDQF
jgi:hypothetical protein